MSREVCNDGKNDDKMVNSLNQFEDWLRREGVWIHPNVKICPSTISRYTVCCKRQSIEAHETILKVPKSAILCLRNSFDSETAEKLKESGINGMLGVCIAYMHEDSKGETTRFKEYLAVLPGWENQSRFWSDTEKQWLAGSEVEFLGGVDESEILNVYSSSVLPILDEFEILQKGYFTYENFKRSMSIVSSRAFEIDAYRELALVPFADMFDHEISAHVQFETNYSVCIDCGSYQPCDHDREEKNSTDNDDIMPHIKPIMNHSSEEQDTCDLVLTKTVEVEEQIYNSYGDLGNGVLLSRYGFELPLNPYSRVRLARELYMNKRIDKSRRRWWKRNCVDAIDRILNQLSDEENFEADDEEDGHSFHLNTLTLSWSGTPSIGLLAFLLLLTASESQFNSLTSTAPDAWYEMAQKVKSMQDFSVNCLSYNAHILEACELGINACIRRRKRLLPIVPSNTISASETVQQSRLAIATEVKAQEDDIIDKGEIMFLTIKSNHSKQQN